MNELKVRVFLFSSKSPTASLWERQTISDLDIAHCDVVIGEKIVLLSVATSLCVDFVADKEYGIRIDCLQRLSDVSRCTNAETIEQFSDLIN